MIINVNRLVEMMGGRTTYSYVRVKNLLSGIKGRSSKAEIQQLRKIIRKELTEIDNALAKLENQ